MSVVIDKILSADKDKCLCRLRHENAIIDALVHGEEQDLEKIKGEEVFVEIDFQDLIRAELIDSYSDKLSRIDQEGCEPGITSIVCKLHSVLEVGPGECVYDFYIQNGPEFLSVSSKEIEITVNVGQGVRLSVSGLCFYPTNT